ncbi:hypothetical protein [Profundibacterium mesophilum]|uniref:VPEID-CTERM sorting domain-containing protein n=1 Tax=Profundibacterium mesophilum KAUST100406-0324 TaxID=1037889 RepID=A0A921TC61_9RHOB|nr:hypothetical protein [Profundibacterium mesophilum]KAF0674487.1 hypothetical protein PMES_03214 [Profundibacterium mesophilum KAUST100406-0324]
MKYVLTLIALTAASPAAAHGITPIHAGSPAPLIAGVVVLAVAAALARLRRHAA